VKTAIIPLMEPIIIIAIFVTAAAETGIVFICFGRIKMKIVAIAHICGSADFATNASTVRSVTTAITAKIVLTLMTRNFVMIALVAMIVSGVLGFGVRNIAFSINLIQKRNMRRRLKKLIGSECPMNLKN